MKTEILADFQIRISVPLITNENLLQGLIEFEFSLYPS